MGPLDWESSGLATRPLLPNIYAPSLYLIKVRLVLFEIKLDLPNGFWYLFYRPRKDERLNRHWSHPAVLNMGPLDWESSGLATRPLLPNIYAPSLYLIKVRLVLFEIKLDLPNGLSS